MLKIKNLVDLKKYLETRLEMAKRQRAESGTQSGRNAAGMIFAFEESIKALDALLNPEGKAVVKCELCRAHVDVSGNNYVPPGADTVVCEACCQVLIDRARSSIKAAVKADRDIDQYDLGGSD